MSITDIIIQIATSFFGTLGFGILFNIRKKHLALAAIGGALFWGLFLAFPMRITIITISISS